MLSDIVLVKSKP